MTIAGWYIWRNWDSLYKSVAICVKQIPDLTKGAVQLYPFTNTDTLFGAIGDATKKNPITFPKNAL